jgi:cyclic pyranopterin phosphate synthase
VPDIALTDRYNRHLNYLRVSITDRCNLKCIYCQPRGDIAKLDHQDILTYEEILRIVKIAGRLGVSKVRVTGGEPLVRKGVYRFLAQLRGIQALTDVSLTTNALLLAKHIQDLKRAGIRRINISLDTLEKEKFAKITGFDRFEAVWSGIMKAHEAGFSPIKINTVALPGINDDELQNLAGLTRRLPFHVRFIEYMPIGASALTGSKALLAPKIRSRIESVLGPLEPVAGSQNDGPASRFRFEDAAGEVGFITALSHHFCHRCNRLRLTAAGQLRTCLLSDYQIDLKAPIRRGCSDTAIAEIFMEAVAHKSRRHSLTEIPGQSVVGQMSAIGG